MVDNKFYIHQNALRLSSSDLNVQGMELVIMSMWSLAGIEKVAYNDDEAAFDDSGPQFEFLYLLEDLLLALQLLQLVELQLLPLLLLLLQLLNLFQLLVELAQRLLVVRQRACGRRGGARPCLRLNLLSCTAASRGRLGLGRRLLPLLVLLRGLGQRLLLRVLQESRKIVS